MHKHDVANTVRISANRPKPASTHTTFKIDPTNITNMPVPEWIVDLAPVVFSGLLVYFAKKQRDINEEQKKLNEYQNSSILRIESWDYIPQEEMEGGASLNPDYLELQCSNFGSGPAFDIRSQFHIRGENNGCDCDGLTWKGNVEEVVSALNDGQIHVTGLNSEGAAVGSDERDVCLTSIMGFEADDLEEYWGIELEGYSGSIRPRSVCEILLNELDEEELKIGSSLWHKDGSGIRGPQYLQFVSVTEQEIDRYDTIAEVLQKGEPLRPDEVPGRTEDWWSE